MGYTVAEYMPKPGKEDISPLVESKGALPPPESGDRRVPDADFDLCARDVRRHDPDRFFASVFAPPEMRRALIALYGFNLEIARTRETVSEPMLGHIRLQWWREALDGIWRGEPREHAVAMALHDAVGRHSLSRSLLEEMIDGRERDLDDAPPASLDEVVSYASATSGALVALALEVAGQGGAGTAARDAGIAYALTGLIRAIPFHARQGRSFLPGLHGNEVTPDAPTLRQQVEALAGASDGHRRKAAEGIGALPRIARSVCLPLAPCRADLSCLRQAGFDPFAARYAGPLPRRLRMLAAHVTGRF